MKLIEDIKLFGMNSTKERSGFMGKYEDLEKLNKLKEDGVLTEEEFNAEKVKILNREESTINENTDNNITINENVLEIKGDFPIAESKIKLQLQDGEKIILQQAGVITGGIAINGYITLTNRRILFSKSNGKNALAGGLIMVAATQNKDEEIKFSQIISIKPAKYLAGSAGIEIVTSDGYTHKYVLQSMNMFSKEPNKKRDMLIELVQNVINFK